MFGDSIQEGKAPFTVASIETPCLTYYKICGDLQSHNPPVVVLHGGPGTGHEYCLPFRKLWSRYGIPVVFYDQIGCAASTHLPQTAADQSFWQIDLFVAELENLLDHLRLGRSDGPGFHILGHSFGGRIAADFAARRPPGLRRLVLASASADGQLFFQGVWQLKKQLSQEAQQAIDEAAQQGHFTAPAYKDAYTEFVRKFLCRADPWPPEELVMSFKHLNEDPTVREAMQGPSPWVYNGTLAKHSSIPLLAQISASTLVYNGEFDTTQDEATVPFFDHIPRVKWVTIAHASHMPHLDSAEMQEKVLELVGKFLREPDGVSEKTRQTLT